jgi:peptidoglycan/LPS O-acetylase OafA/YrhL
VLLVAGARRGRWIAASGAIAFAAFRWIFWAHYARVGFNVQSQVRMDALLVGCLLALLLAGPPLRSLAVKWSRLWALPALAGLLFCIAHFEAMTPLCESVAIAGLISASLLHPASLFSKPLVLAPLVWLGTVSYSVYLWQELFMPIGRTPATHLVSLCVAMPVFALGSYYCIERPSTRLGHRLARGQNELPYPPGPIRAQDFAA